MPKHGFILVAAVALGLPCACGGRLATVGDSGGSDSALPTETDGSGNAGGGSITDATLGSDAHASDGPSGNDAAQEADAPRDGDSDSEVFDTGADADAGIRDASPCPPDDVPPAEVPSQSTITFHLVNGGSSARFVLVQATECEAFSFALASPVRPVLTLIPHQCGCFQCALPPEDLHFVRIGPGESVDVGWDARALAQYETYENCRPYAQQCDGLLHGVPRPVDPNAYVATFLVAREVPTGSGTSCTALPNGDVSCQVANVQGAGQCTGNNFGLQPDFVQQGFNVPTFGNQTVAVTIP